MNNKGLVSVIIPVYDVEEFLPHCLDSVLSQTYKNIEILVVDDGANDKSGDICDEYEKKDSRIKVIHQENEGLSSARNKGLQISKGEWVFFIDSDDRIDSDTLNQAYEFAKKNNCDIVQVNHYYEYEDYLLYRKASKKEKKNIVLNRHSTMKELIINDRIKNFAWGKLYKSELVKDCLFPVGKYYEDSFWQHLIFDKIERYGIIDNPLYYYRQREGSISSVCSEKQQDLVEGYNNRLQFVKENYPEFEELMKEKYLIIKSLIFHECVTSSYWKRIADWLEGFRKFKRIKI